MNSNCFYQAWKGETMLETIKTVIYKVAIYIRLSKEDEGINKESESITNQREYIKEYAEKNGMIIYDY